MNEPRNKHSNGTAEMQEWITIMATHVKQYANQLVTIGQDGFYGHSNCMSEKCPPTIHQHLIDLSCSACSNMDILLSLMPWSRAAPSKK